MSENTSTAAPATAEGGLRAAKREQAAAKKATAPAKASTKKEPAKATEKQPTEKQPKLSIRWQYLSGERGNGPQTGTAADGTTYEITAGGDKWQAVMTQPGGKPTTLAEGVSKGVAYAHCVKAAKVIAAAAA